MKNLSILPRDRRKKPKNWGSKLNIALNFSEFDAKSYVVLTISKVGFFSTNINQSIPII